MTALNILVNKEEDKPFIHLRAQFDCCYKTTANTNNMDVPSFTALILLDTIVQCSSLQNKL